MTSASAPVIDPGYRLEANGRKPSGPVVLVVMDGVGIGLNDQYDAVSQARTPTLDHLTSSYPWRKIGAHGTFVGLPSDSDMGNSEVGHNTMGAGMVLDQGATRIEKAIETGEIWQGVWADAVKQVGENDSTLHFAGLLSDGNVHSHINHLFAMLDRAALDSVRTVRVHVLLDGRDVPDRSAHEYISALEDKLRSLNAESDRDYRIASGGGRMRITMDRYGANWAMVERGWQAHVLGGARKFPSASEALTVLRAENPGISDQLVPEFCVADETGEATGPVHEDDAFIFFNFRGDRAIELSEAFEAEAFDKFDRVLPEGVLYAGMILYDGDTDTPRLRLVEPATAEGSVSERLSASGVRQFACAETQKYGHVTYFWNGNRSDPFVPALETYVEVPSDVVPFDERPWMKSGETADATCAAIASGDYDFIRVNFAGGDMVGHTGEFLPTIIAMESVDLALGRILRAVRAVDGCLVVTADHGNAEDMVERGKDGAPKLDPSGSPVYKTSHSVNPVPLIVADFGGRDVSMPDVERAGLSNLASTLCELLGFVAPRDFDLPLVSLGRQG